MLTASEIIPFIVLEMKFKVNINKFTVYIYRYIILDISQFDLLKSYSKRDNVFLKNTNFFFRKLIKLFTYSIVAVHSNGSRLILVCNTNYFFNVFSFSFAATENCWKCSLVTHVCFLCNIFWQASSLLNLKKREKLPTGFYD